MLMHDLTALILTRNERENIERTLSALAWVPHVLIVDSFSTDDTCERAARFSQVEIVKREFDTFAGQCNFGLAQIKTPWVLSLDADYILTPDLIGELRELEPDEGIAGYSAVFRYCVYGRPLRDTIYPPRTILYRRDRAHYEDEGHGHRVRIDGLVISLKGKMDHDDRKPLSRWIRSQDGYCKVEARHLLATPNDRLNRQDRLRKRIYFAPLVIFFYLLFGRGLILDGWPAWYYVCQRAIAEMLLSLRLLTDREGLEPTPSESSTES
jgi:glycosyltransferase involved in cell wall biosynthesis